MALTKALKEAVSLKVLMSELSLKQNGVLLQCNSQSTIYLPKNQAYHAAQSTKYIHDCVNSGEVFIEKVHTDENMVGMLIKPVTIEKFRHCLSLLNITLC